MKIKKTIYTIYKQNYYNIPQTKKIYQGLV